MKSWQEGGGPEYTCSENECFYEWKSDEVQAKHRKSIALQLGPQLDLDVPDSLKKYYEYLMSPFETMYISRGGCGFALVDEPFRSPSGRESIDALVKYKRLDMIVNVLRGPNPGARVYAVLALKRLRRDGIVLPPGTAATMSKVESLSVPVTMCFGCIVSSGLRASDVVNRWRDIER